MARTILVSLPLFLMACTGEQGVKAFNAEPEAEITSHADGAEVLEGYTESFRGAVSDPDHAADDLTATWYLDGDVVCESAAPDEDGFSLCDVPIPATASQITLEVQDPENAAGSDQISLTVTPTDAPEAEITAPAAEGVFYSDQLITFEGTVSDSEDAATELVASWESSLDGVLDLDAEPDDTGALAGAVNLTEGEHFVTLTATDTTGKSGSDNVTVTVGPPNSAPSCEITAPADGTAGEEGDTVLFEAMVSDVDVSSDWLAVTWTSDKDGGLGESTPDSAGAVAFPYADLSVETHAITLTVTDEVGASCSDFILYSVGTPPEISLASPTSGDVVAEGELVSFSATVSDNEDSPTDLVLSWVSDLDGEFSTQGSDSTGTIAFTESSLTTGTHTLTATVTDTDGLYASALLTLQVNGLPTAPTVELGPDPATTSDDLVVSILTDSTDPDGDPISYSYAWSVDGVASSASSTDTLAFTETEKGQVWTVEVRPNDGISDGPSGSDDLAIGNTAPEITSVVIDPDPATPADELSCSWSFYDEDGDSDASTLEWSIDGTTVGTDSTLSGLFSVGDEVVCTVMAHDGEDSGSSDSASITISNTPPEVLEVVLSPSVVYTNDSLSATVETEDAEGDVVSVAYEWVVDGSVVAETGATLDGVSWFDKDHEVYVVVTPDDGTDTGSTLSSITVTVSNTPPEAPEISIEPAEPLATIDDLLCQVDVDSADDDGDAMSYTVSWEVDGVAYTGATTTTWTDDTVPASDLAADEIWTCTVTPDDGDELGATASASVLVSPSSCFEGWDAEVDLGAADYGLVGIDAGGFAGFDVSIAGDVDGDGLADVLVGAHRDDTGGIQAGSVALFLGADLTSDASLDLDEAHVHFLGDVADDYAGYSASSAGDVDGDGLADILIGAPQEDTAGASAGMVYLFYGSSLLEPGEVLLSEADVIFGGEASQDWAGVSVASAGDVDGDGLDDLLIGAFAHDTGGTDAGITYLVLAASLGSSSQISLADADTRFVGVNDHDYTGSTVASAGDVDGDGLGDFAIGASSNDDGGSNAGVVYLFLGGSLDTSTSHDVTDADYRFVGEAAYDQAGRSVGHADVDGDGLDDLLIGAPGSDEAANDAGKNYIILGSSLGASSVVDLGDADHALVGEIESDSSGMSIAGGGDVDGDGLEEVLIGAPYSQYPSSVGQVYLVTGASLAGTTSLDLADADTLFVGEDSDNMAGWSVAASDVNGDGFSDLLMGAYGNDDGGTDAGQAHLFFAPNGCNTPPRGAEISIAPAEPIEGVDDLVCAVDTEAYDAEGDSVSYSFAWEVDGVDYTGATTTSETGDTVPASDTFEEEVWTCRVTASDGTGDGGVAWAAVTIEAGCTEDSGSGEDCPGESCLQILDDGLDTGDGYYWLDPDGSGAVEMYCDMTLDGGGWTRIHKADSTSIYEPTGMDYSFDYQVLRDDADEALMAFMDQSDDSYHSSYAQFDMPSDWVAQSPFLYSGTSSSVDVRIDGGSSSTQTLRYGYSNIGAFDTCSSITFPASGSPFGILCITNTSAPFYGGWAETVGDYCTDSDLSLDAGRCVGNNMLAIFVR
jgi:hypothetical protein